MTWIEDMRAITDAATPGPVEPFDANESTNYGPLWSVANNAFHNPPPDDNEPWVGVEIRVGSRENAEFLALAWNAFPAMLDALEAAEKLAFLYKTAEFKELQDYLARVREHGRPTDNARR